MEKKIPDSEIRNPKSEIERLPLRALVVYAAMSAAFLLIQKTDLFPHLLIPFLLLYLPLALIRYEKGDMAHFGLGFRDWKWSEIEIALRVSGLILLPYFLLNSSQLFVDLVQWHSRGGSVPYGRIFSLIGVEFFLVGLPEEVFFRGYLQTHLDEAYPKRFKVFKTQLGLGSVLTAALFALTHFLLLGHLFSLTVFFPALVFGWLRERTGRVLAPTIFHALANVVYFVAPLSF